MAGNRSAIVRLMQAVAGFVLLGMISRGPTHAQELVPNPLFAPMDSVPANITFDIVSFKRCPPDKFGTSKVDMPMTADYLAYHCESLSRLIYFAYDGSVKVYSVEPGYPSWVDEDRYEFVVKVAPQDIPSWQKLDLTARRVLIRKVLAETVKLKIRVDSSPKAIYALTATKKPKITPYKVGDQTKLPDGTVQTGRTFNWIRGTIYLQAFTMPDFATVLSVQTDRVVADHTNLTGSFTFGLPLMGRNLEPDSRMGPDENAPTLEDGLEALGLRLEPAKAPVEQLVIDHIEKPEEN